MPKKKSMLNKKQLKKDVFRSKCISKCFMEMYSYKIRLVCEENKISSVTEKILKTKFQTYGEMYLIAKA